MRARRRQNRSAIYLQELLPLVAIAGLYCEPDCTVEQELCRLLSLNHLVHPESHLRYPAVHFHLPTFIRLQQNVD